MCTFNYVKILWKGCGHSTTDGKKQECAEWNKWGTRCCLIDDKHEIDSQTRDRKCPTCSAGGEDDGDSKGAKEDPKQKDGGPVRRSSRLAGKT